MLDMEMQRILGCTRSPWAHLTFRPDPWYSPFYNENSSATYCYSRQPSKASCRPWERAGNVRLGSGLSVAPHLLRPKGRTSGLLSAIYFFSYEACYIFLGFSLPSTPCFVASSCLLWYSERWLKKTRSILKEGIRGFPPEGLSRHRPWGCPACQWLPALGFF